MTFEIKHKNIDKNMQLVEQEYQQTIKEIANNLKSTNSFITKKELIKRLFDWWQENIQYDNTILEQPRNNNGTGKYPNITYPYKNTLILASEKYAPILLKKGICESFSIAFKDICELIGVECKVINSGDNNVISDYKKYAHAWNEVYIDGKYKTIDLTPNFLTFMGDLRTEKFTIHEKGL